LYLRYDEERDRASYFWALLLFCLSLFTKTVTPTLPAALLVLFWWQRKELSWQREIRPLLPFFFVGAAAGLFTIWTERTFQHAQGPLFQFTLVERVLIAGRAVWFYLGKLIFPSHLCFIYPRWSVSQSEPAQYLFPAFALFFYAFLWRERSRWPGL